jgi:hypothetical protein
VRFRTRLGFAVTAAAACAAVVLGVGFGGSPSPAAAEAKVAARRTAVLFLNALDRGHWNQACSMLSRTFYRRHHVVDRKHCVAGLKVAMGGTAVKFRIDRVRAHGTTAVVHAVVDGSPGTVQLVRESGRFRVLDVHADKA